MMRRGQGEILDDALDGIERALTGGTRDELEPRRDSKWWGWGDPGTLPELDDAAIGALRERIGELTAKPRAAELEGFSLPAAEAAAAGSARRRRPGGRLHSLEDRVRHATGSGYADLARLRLGALEAAPDAVVLPDSAEQLRRVLEVCAAEGIAVVPFGGGTSVVGGVAPERGPHSRLISLDLAAPVAGSRSTGAR